MKVALVKIGNSRGIRIPKPMIEACGFGSTVELRMEKNRLYIERGDAPRSGWGEAFRSAGSPASDELLLDSIAPNRLTARRGSGDSQA